MKLSQNGLTELEFSEGLKLTAYLCSAKVWSIGLGTTIYPNGEPVKKGDRITEAEAYEYALNDLAKFGQQVSRLVKVPLTQNQFDALVLLIYNIGGKAFENSTVLERLNTSDYKGAAKAFMMWDKITDPQTKKLVFSQGLHNRRKREMALFKNAAKQIRNVPDPNNIPLPNHTLPLPTAYQEYGIDSPTESMPKDNTKVIAATTSVGAVGIGGITTIIADPQFISPILTFLQSADWRVALSVIFVLSLGALIWRICNRRRK